MHVIDLEGNEYALQATTTNDYELNGNQSISFRILPSKVNKLFIDDITEMWKVVDHDDITHKIVYLKKQGTGDSLSVEVKAVPLIFDDLDSQRIYERYDRSMTANYCFNLIFEGSGYNFILNGTFESQEWEGFGEGDTRLTLFKKALERYKAEFRVSGNTVYIENRIGRDTQFMYRYRLNASNIVQENDATAYWTYAKGYGDYGDGDGGEDWQDAELIREYTSPIASIIGKREAPPIKNGNITTQKTMDEQLKTLVDESLKISVTATIHDLRKQGYALAQPEMGDRVFLIDERIGLNAEVRVVHMQLVRNWKGDVLDISLTFGTPGLVKRHQSNLQSAISNITQLLEGRLKLPFSVLDNAVAEATKALTRMQSELTISDNGSLVAVDKTNPNNVVVLNAAGLGVSDDGGATFQNAITGQGINGRALIAKSVLADVIAGGILTSLNGRTEWNMNDGDMYSHNTNWTFGTGAQINFLSNNNKMTYRKFDEQSNFSRSAGVGFGDAIGGRYPFTYIGTHGSSELNTLSEYFSGFIANTTARIAEGEANSINGMRLQFRNLAVGWTKGLTFDFTGTPEIIPINGHQHNYNIGNSSYLFHNLYIRGLYTVGGFEIRNNAVNDIGWRLSTIQESGRISLRGLNMGAYNYDLGSSESHNRFFYGYISHLRPSSLDGGSGVGSSDLPYRYGHIRSLTVHENFYNNSLRVYKENIEDLPLDVAIDFVKHNQIKTFNYINSEERSVGLIRDEVVISDQSLIGTETAIAPTNIQFINQKVLQNLLERVEALENGAEPAE